MFRTKSRKEQLTEQIQDQSDSLASTAAMVADQLRERVVPAVGQVTENAMEWARPRVEHGIEVAAPRLESAVNGLAPRVDTARDKIVDELIPRIAEAISAWAAASAAAKDEAVSRGQGAAAVISGEAVASPKGRKKRVLLILGLLGAAAVAILAVVALLLPGSVGTPANVPNGLNLTLDRLPAHTVIFNASALGGWLLWAHPSLEPVIDGRSEAFTVAHFEGYIATSQVRAGWERFLQTTDSNYALVEDQSPLATALDERLHWRSLGTDDGYVLLAAP